jgi:hypothetical protein
MVLVDLMQEYLRAKSGYDIYRVCYVKSSYVVAATEVKKSRIASIKVFCSYFTILKFQQVQYSKRFESN